jgi:xanthine dehydrogenase YagR molybdenum-binding subunit
VRYYGQAIGLVIAETFEQARDAAALVDTRYDARPAGSSCTAGLAGAAPPPSGSPATDVLAPGVGSIDEALTGSQVRISATYTTPEHNHNAMEPHPTVASWTGDHLTIHTATQGVLLVVARLANALGVDAAKIHVLNPYVGGGFGNKWGIWAHTPLTAAAARAPGRPVKTMLTREQAFTVVVHRPASSQTVCLGAARDDSASPVAANAGGSGSTSTNGVVDAGRYRRVRIVGTAGAVANAVYDATGRRVRDLPITLDKLLP